MMQKISARLLLPLLILTAAASQASAQMEEVVVTAERRGEYAESAPNVVLVRRADHLITSVQVTCDTRDASQRKEELKETLRNMITAAGRSQMMSLGLGNSVLGELKENNFDEIIGPDSRPDTSRAVVVVKTTISADDTYESATARVKAFIEKTAKVGRTEILRQGSWNLTLIGPEQYHDALITRIAAESKKAADSFGAGYGVSIDGLERPVAWYQKGPLDLALYIPYSLHVAPLGAH
jgi:hypothetical protein